MGVVMDMSSYEIERSETEYGEEVLCSGWNPALNLACQQIPQTEAEHGKLPPSLATVDAETFLQRMYTYQR